MSTPARVLMISGEYPPMEGGVGDFTHLLSEALTRLGVRVCVLTSHRASGEATNDALLVKPLVSSWRWYSLYRVFHRVASEFQPDVINIQYQTAAYGMHPAVNFLPRLFSSYPFVVTFHDLRVPYLFPKAGRLRWWVNESLARSSRAVIVTNEEDRCRLMRTRGIKKLSLVPIGSNIALQLPSGFTREEWRRRLGIPEQALLLCYFGFLNESKGGEELIDALDHLQRKGYQVHLLMIGGVVGSSDPTNKVYLERVKERIRNYRLEHRVHWTGYLSPEKVSASFLISDICVLPYRDGASFRRGSLMAAITHGMPIISTWPRVRLPELTHGENIWLVPPRDARALSHAITLLAQDAELRRRLGRGALELSRCFDWQKIAQRTLEVYRAL